MAAAAAPGAGPPVAAGAASAPRPSSTVPLAEPGPPSAAACGVRVLRGLMHTRWRCLFGLLPPAEAGARVDQGGSSPQGQGPCRQKLLRLRPWRGCTGRRLQPGAVVRSYADPCAGRTLRHAMPWGGTRSRTREGQLSRGSTTTQQAAGPSAPECSTARLPASPPPAGGCMTCCRGTGCNRVEQ